MSGLVLGIDTSSVVCAGLAANGQVIASLTVSDTRAHAEQLSPLVRQVLAAAETSLSDLDSIAVGVGPGPFTGLRVGVVAAAVLAEVARVPLKGVCGLDVLARQAVADGLSPEGGDFLVATDARRKEWYWASYHDDGTRASGPFVTAPDGLPELPRVGPVSGTGIQLDAGRLAAFAAELPDAGLEPLYLRRPDAEVPTVRKSTLLPPRLATRRPQ